MPSLRKIFSAEYLYKLVNKKFQSVQEPTRNRVCNFSLADCLMSGLAVFSLKYPSLLQFDQDSTKTLKNNLKQDRANKDDCKRNAAKRLLENLRREHSFLKVIVVKDGLTSNCPHINTLQALNCSYILGVKPGGHKKFI